VKDLLQGGINERFLWLKETGASLDCVLMHFRQRMHEWVADYGRKRQQFVHMFSVVDIYSDCINVNANCTACLVLLICLQVRFALLNAE